MRRRAWCVGIPGCAAPGLDVVPGVDGDDGVVCWGLAVLPGVGLAGLLELGVIVCAPLLPAVPGDQLCATASVAVPRAHVRNMPVMSGLVFIENLQIFS